VTGDAVPAPTAHQPIRGSRVKKGLVIVNTGDGKGKTTAALGLLLRAWGRGMRVEMHQFIKVPTANYGEHRAAKKLGIPIVPLGAGFTWLTGEEQSRDLALRQWERCKSAILEGNLEVVILDEFTYVLHYGWLPVAEAIEVLERRPPMLHVVITGRNAPPELVDYADLVTEMRVVKHPYRDQGIKAQPGIEF
jgi:cob(I)alamin adenosyltransferase